MKIYAMLPCAAILLGAQDIVYALDQGQDYEDSDETASFVPTAAPPTPPRDSPPPPPVVPKRPNPIPKGNPGNWASTIDYPAKALIEEREGNVSFSVRVGADGRATSCEITQSSGHNDLDETTCLNISRRARFDPALDDAGNPTTGKWSSRVRWQIPQSSSNASSALISESYPHPPILNDGSPIRIAKEAYPESALTERRQGITRFTVAADASGKVQGCSIIATSGYDDLDLRTCDIARTWVYAPARNLEGEPVPGRSTHVLNWRLPKVESANATVPATNAAISNPFQNTGGVTLAMAFDANGKVLDCRFEHTGGMTGLTGLDGKAINICDLYTRMNFRPITDQTGAPVATKVIQKTVIEHLPVLSGSSAD